MGFNELNVEIKGLTPTIMHNGQLCDPTNPIVREMKKLTSKKRNKTDDDIVELARLEFCGSLYLNEQLRPCWPGEIIEAMIRSAARTQRKGKDVEKGVLSDGNWPLLYDGPKTVDELWLDQRFRKVAPVRVGQARVIRTRPIFFPWSLAFSVLYDSRTVNRDDVINWLEIAGRDIGLSEWRPKHGRFEVAKVE